MKEVKSESREMEKNRRGIKRELVENYMETSHVQDSQDQIDLFA